VVLEAGVRLVSHVVVEGDTRIGAGAVISPFATIGMPPQDIKYAGERTRCIIGPRTMIREHCSIHRGTPGGRGVTTIGADCMLMAVVHVAHDCDIGNSVVIANNVVMGGHVVIGDHAVIGGSAAIHQFVRIGRGAMVGGMVGVPGDVVPFGTVGADRAGYVGALNIIGMKRRGYTRAQMHSLRSACKIIFDSRDPLPERMERAMAAYGDEKLVLELLEFVKTQSRRGLTPAHLAGDDGLV
jgi:UDP-N-acetylglucosamine acyltransferase